MKLNNELIIDAKRETVWSAFDDSSMRSKWQTGLTAWRQISGKPNQIGAVAELTYEENGRSRKATETVTERRQPSFLATTYESKQRNMLTVNSFESVGGKQTRWSVWSNIRFRGVATMTSLFSANRIRQQLEDDMQRFKLLVETLEASTRS